jgi:hypothetical protein
MTKRTKILIGVLVAAVVAVLAFFALEKQQMTATDESAEVATTTESGTEAATSPKAAAPARTASGGNAASQPNPAPAASAATAPTVVWRFTEHGAESNGSLTTDIVLTVDGRQYEAGTYLGKCKTISADELNSSSEVSGVACLRGGTTGTEIGVFLVNGKYVVQKGDLQENDPRVADKRGPFTTILTLGA